MTSSPLETPPALHLGIVPGVIVRKWSRVWAERFRHERLEVTLFSQAAAEQALSDGEIDMAFLRYPEEHALPAHPALHQIPLYTEQQVAVFPAEHAGAAHDEMTLDELNTYAELSDVDVHTDPSEGTMAMVAGAAVIGLLPHSTARLYARKDTRSVFVTDAARTRIALTWRRDNDNQWIQEFIGIVRGRTANSSRGSR